MRMMKMQHMKTYETIKMMNISNYEIEEHDATNDNEQTDGLGKN